MFNKLNRCTLALMLLTSSMSFSALPTKVVDLSHLYEEDDILKVLENRVGNNPSIHIVPPILELEDDPTKDFMAQSCIDNIEKIANQGIPVQDIKVLIPNFYGNSKDEKGNVVGHWTAAIIRKDKSGAATLYYNDPAGNRYNVNSGRKMIQIFNMQRLKIDTVS